MTGMWRWLHPPVRRENALEWRAVPVLPDCVFPKPGCTKPDHRTTKPPNPPQPYRERYSTSIYPYITTAVYGPRSRRPSLRRSLAPSLPRCPNPRYAKPPSPARYHRDRYNTSVYPHIMTGMWRWLHPPVRRENALEWRAEPVQPDRRLPNPGYTKPPNPPQPHCERYFNSVYPSIRTAVPAPRSRPPDPAISTF